MLKRLLLTLCLLLFAVAAGAQGFKVSDIQIEGNDRIETSTILAATPIKPGDQVTLGEVDAAMHSIFALGRFEDISAKLTEVQGAKILTFVVTELPLVRDIRFEGNDELSEEKLRPLVSLKIPEIYSYAKVAQSIQKIKNAYAEEGYRAVVIKADVKIDEQNEAVLTFKITEGEKVLIDAIRFVGNTAIDADDLKDVMETQERWWLSWMTGRGIYQQDVMDLDVERIKAAYQDKGYIDVKVKQPELTLVKDNRYLDILIEIDEGPQYRVGTIGFKGDLLKPSDELLTLVSLKPGEIFNRSELRKSIERLTDLYADEGYAHVNIAPLSNKHKKKLTIDLMFDIEEGVQVYIERLEVRGNTQTRDKVIRREMPIIEGDKYSASKIKEGNRNIRNLGYFEEVNVTTRPGSAENQAILDIDVKEQPTGTFSIGFGYSSVDQFVLQGSVSQNNFMGYGLKLNLTASLSSKTQTYSLGVTDPYFLDTDWTVGFEVYKTEYEYTDYSEYKNGGAIRAGYPIAKDTKAFLSYRYEQKQILDVAPGVTSRTILDAVGDSTLSSITGEISRNSTDNHQDPSRGGISHFTLEYAGLGGTENYAKMLIEHRQFFPLFWDTVFSIHGETGYVVATGSDEVPLSERFYLGGIRTIRGFKTREVGPKSGDDFIGGKAMGYLNFEYLFPVSKKLGLKGVLFYDTGNAWLDGGDYLSEMRNSVGAGIRWNSPLGPLRFEWGYNLAPEQDEKKSVFEFSIGTAF
ncbi:MAG: outer membrane protein assembly factor BamA [Deltaproteobacteria bacterium]|nr:outer membrane protein assembly factor BamA [Deltaproteobacteria bacterium]